MENKNDCVSFLEEINLYIQTVKSKIDKQDYESAINKLNELQKKVDKKIQSKKEI